MQGRADKLGALTSLGPKANCLGFNLAALILWSANLAGYCRWLSLLEKHLPYILGEKFTRQIPRFTRSEYDCNRNRIRNGNRI